MSKRKISKRHALKLSDIQRVNIDESAFTELKPEAYFTDYTKVAEALLQSLIDNDTQAYVEILGAYLRVNRSRVSRNAKIARSTVKLALSAKGNPTLKTIAKIVHESIVRK